MPLAGGILFFITGLATAPYCLVPDLPVAIPALLAGTVLVADKTGLFRCGRALLPLFFFAAGFFLYTDAIYLENQPELEQVINDHNPTKIHGIISGIEDRPAEAAIFYLTPFQVQIDGRHSSFAGTLRIFVETFDSDLQPGDSVVLQSKLKRPRNFATPGAFDYERYMIRRHIVATGFVRDSASVARLAGKHDTGITTAIIQWRHRVRRLVNHSVEPEVAPLVNALAIGDRGAIAPAQRRLLAGSGIAHLFAISGLHLGLVATLLYLIIRSLYLRTIAERIGLPPRQIVPLVILPVLLLYMIFTGSAISTVRALAMLATTALLCTFLRRSRPIDILAAMGFLILLFDPLVLFEPSFQLSVCGVAGIVLTLPYWNRRLHDWPKPLRYTALLMITTLAATIATLPASLHHFHLIAPLAPLTNLLAIPIVTFILVPLLLSALLSAPICPPLAAQLFSEAGWILDGLMRIFSFCVAFKPFAPKYLFLTLSNLVALALVVLLIFSFRRLSRRAVLLVLITICLLALPGSWWRRSGDHLQLTVFDVGQGDSALVQLPNGRTLLVDGGGFYSDTFDTGERLIAPALGHLGITELDAVILTHDHLDHRKGLAFILEHFDVAEFWSPLTISALHPSLISILEEKSIPVRRFPGGWHAAGSPDDGLYIFVPENSSPNPNEQSLALLARFHSDGLLITGDLEKQGVSDLVASPIPAPITLTEIPHHGSRNSQPQALLDLVQPSTAYISVGFNNRYGHPHPDLLAGVRKQVQPISRTDLDGTTRFVSTGDGWAITHWKKGLFR